MFDPCRQLTAEQYASEPMPGLLFWAKEQLPQQT